MEGIMGSYAIIRIVMKEIWKDIIGFGGKYQISNLGRLKLKVDQRKHKAGYIFAKRYDKYGYIEYMLTHNKKRYPRKGHRLVAEAFINNPNKLATVNHKNGIKDDNRVSNLEWMSLRNNALHSIYILGNMPQGRMGFGTQPHKVLCVETNIIYNSITEAAINTNHHQGNISRALSTGWKAGGYHWKRVD